MGGKKRRKKRRVWLLLLLGAGTGSLVLYCNFFNAESVDHFSFLGQKEIIFGLVIGRLHAKPSRNCVQDTDQFLRGETWLKSVPLGFRRKSILPRTTVEVRYTVKLKLGIGPGHYARFLLNQGYQSAKRNHHHSHFHGSWSQHNRPINPPGSHICGAHPPHRNHHHNSFPHRNHYPIPSVTTRAMRNVITIKSNH